MLNKNFAFFLEKIFLSQIILINNGLSKLLNDQND